MLTEVQQAAQLVALHGGLRAAARASGITYTTLHRRYSRAADDHYDGVEFPVLPPSELSAQDLIEQACDRFNQHLEARDARRWFEIKIKSNDPIGVCFVGDPHVDNNGCNWPLLKEHIGLLERTPGLYAVNIGDLTDNWVGRLQRLYADQEMSKKQAWKLAAYLLKDANIRWLAHILDI